MGGLRRLEVRNSNQKSLQILGSITNILAQRKAAAAKLAEGEELGSNLLRVAKSGLWVRAVP
jgi:hypothetical protein